MKFVSSGPNADTVGQDFCQNDGGPVGILGLYPNIPKMIIYILWFSSPSQEQLLLSIVVVCLDGRAGDTFGGSYES